MTPPPYTGAYASRISGDPETLLAPQLSKLPLARSCTSAKSAFKSAIYVGCHSNLLSFKSLVGSHSLKKAHGDVRAERWSWRAPQIHGTELRNTCPLRPSLLWVARLGPAGVLRDPTITWDLDYFGIPR